MKNEQVITGTGVNQPFGVLNFGNKNDGGYYMPKSAHDALVVGMTHKGDSAVRGTSPIAEAIRVLNESRYDPAKMEQLAEDMAVTISALEKLGKPVWSYTPPTVPGWYWCSFNDRINAPPAYFDGTFWTNTGAWEDEDNKITEWCGPITPPE